MELEEFIYLSGIGRHQEFKASILGLVKWRKGFVQAKYGLEAIFQLTIL